MIMIESTIMIGAIVLIILAVELGWLIGKITDDSPK